MVSSPISLMKLPGVPSSDSLSCFGRQRRHLSVTLRAEDTSWLFALQRERPTAYLATSCENVLASPGTSSPLSLPLPLPRCKAVPKFGNAGTNKTCLRLLILIQHHAGCLPCAGFLSSWGSGALPQWSLFGMTEFQIPSRLYTPHIQGECIVKA